MMDGVKQMIFDPKIHGKRMTIVCFISGSGTNYQKIVERDPEHDYIVFTNRPGCEGVAKAQANNHPVIELSHVPYLKETRSKYGAGKVPRNCPEREQYEQEVSRLIEEKAGKMADLVCLAGYDQWMTDWTVDKYYPKLLNVHPGDTTKGYAGLHWVPTAKAILAGDEAIRTTLFLVDRGEDTGPILAQSRPLNIGQTLSRLETEGTKGLIEGLEKVKQFVRKQAVSSYDDFEKTADTELKSIMKTLCENLQNALKVAGDWEVYPFTVHSLIAQGRVEVDGRIIYINGKQMPVYGYRMEQPLP